MLFGLTIEARADAPFVTATHEADLTKTPDPVILQCSIMTVAAIEARRKACQGARRNADGDLPVMCWKARVK